VSEDALIQLVEYIKSLKTSEELKTGETTNQVGQPPAHTEDNPVPEVNTR